MLQHAPVLSVSFSVLSELQLRVGFWCWRGWRRPRGTCCQFSITCWRIERCSWKMDAFSCQHSATTNSWRWGQTCCLQPSLWLQKQTDQSEIWPLTHVFWLFLHLLLGCILTNRITSRRGRHIPVNTWYFNRSLLSTFLISLKVGCIYMGFFWSLHLISRNNLAEFTYETERRQQKTIREQQLFFLL